MNRDLLIYGAGGAGRELAFFLSLDKNPKTAWKVKGFIDDTRKLQGKIVNGIPVLGGFEYLKNYSGNLTVTVVDKPALRRKLIQKIQKYKNIHFPVVLNSISVVSPFVEWGEGCIIASTHNVLSVNMKLGEFVYIHGANRIGHDVVIGDYSTIFTGILFGGGVSVGSGCVIGSGAVILPKVKIGNGSIIGGGSVVTRDIPSNVVASGVPAEVIKTIKAR
jgi:sugar O-acyltransferase (sialic acid O-acetyltransferase NeuD family)